MVIAPCVSDLVSYFIMFIQKSVYKTYISIKKLFTIVCLWFVYIVQVVHTFITCLSSIKIHNYVWVLSKPSIQCLKCLCIKATVILINWFPELPIKVEWSWWKNKCNRPLYFMLCRHAISRFTEPTINLPYMVIKLQKHKNINT